MLSKVKMLLKREPSFPRCLLLSCPADATSWADSADCSLIRWMWWLMDLILSFRPCCPDFRMYWSGWSCCWYYPHPCPRCLRWLSHPARRWLWTLSTRISSRIWVKKRRCVWYVSWSWYLFWFRWWSHWSSTTAPWRLSHSWWVFRGVRWQDPSWGLLSTACTGRKRPRADAGRALSSVPVSWYW